MGLFDPGMGVLAGFIRGSPDIPAWQTISPTQEQSKAINGNLSALPQAEQLAGGVNTFNQQQLEKMLGNAIPDYGALKTGITDNIESLLKGEIPSDVSSQITRNSAVQALSGGYAGSGMHGDLVARDLGLTSLQLTQQGLNSAEQWIKTMASIEQPGMFNVSSMFLSPGQVMAQDTEERNAKFSYEWGKNLMDWQTSTNYALADEITQDSAQFNSMAGTVLGAFAGGKMGGV